MSYVLAPFTPFLAEELYHNLTGDKESVHLKDWMPAGRVNELVVQDMEQVREYVNQALSLRAKERIKIRQPLASVTIPTLGEFVNFDDILTEELNVKKVIQGSELSLDLSLTPELKREGLMREVVRHVQAARKAAGLNVDDHIELSLTVAVAKDGELEKAINEHERTIAAETLTDHYVDNPDGFDTTVAVDEESLRIQLKKSSK
ncbi:MAG: hypothetical protein EOP09_17525 [Proteobacteria bacterium]|nr:MAG: hypothetical protein EOP09_17525 [Pseudomonadota bacterium]